MGKQRLKGKAEDHHQATSSLSTLSHLLEAKGKILEREKTPLLFFLMLLSIKVFFIIA